MEDNIAVLPNAGKGNASDASDGALRSNDGKPILTLSDMLRDAPRFGSLSIRRSISNKYLI
jgi:hypothetical protein